MTEIAAGTHRPLEGRQTVKRLYFRCPNGHPMVERTNSQSGQEFLGCSQWPECRSTRPIPEYLALKRAGAAELPGLETL